MIIFSCVAISIGRTIAITNITTIVTGLLLLLLLLLLLRCLLGHERITIGKTIEYIQILRIIDVILKEEGTHLEEGFRCEKTIASCLMLRSNSLHL